MERVGKVLGMETAFCLAAYLTGRLSLAHIPNGLPLDMLVSSLPLSEDIRQGVTNNAVPLETSIDRDAIAIPVKTNKLLNLFDERHSANLRIS
jgi:hypothetical protein